MRFFKINEKREEQKRILQNQIELIINNSDFIIKKIDINFEHFGNVIVELKNESCILRFTQDRGDVYFEKELNNNTVRPEPQLVFSHIEFAEKNYETLIKAIELKINTTS